MNIYETVLNFENHISFNILYDQPVTDFVTDYNCSDRGTCYIAVPNNNNKKKYR